MQEVLGPADQAAHRCQSEEGAAEGDLGLLDFDECLDEVRIELSAGDGPQFHECLFAGASRPVGPVGDERVVGVDDGHQAGDQRQRVAIDPVGVPGAVHPLVVVADRVDDVGTDVRGDQGRPDRGVGPHQFRLVGVQRAGLVQDRGGNLQFADVVEEPRQAGQLALLRREPDFLADLDRQPRNPARVRPGVDVPPGQFTGEVEE